MVVVVCHCKFPGESNKNLSISNDNEFFSMSAEITSWWEWFVCKVLQSGPIPEHLAFIMDGNRRFAKQNSIPTKEGHTRGFSALKEVLPIPLTIQALRICLNIGVKQVSVYAFSIENFKRAESEVKELFKLFQDKLHELIDSYITQVQLIVFSRFLEEKQVSLRILGDVRLAPEELQQTMAKSVLYSKDFKKFVKS